MPKRTPRQPTQFVDRYRERLNQEMESKKETDRSLADKLTEAGYPISFTAIYKTRTGKRPRRQPAMDECYAVAHALGFGSLDDFLEGPVWQRVERAERGVVHAFREGSMQVRESVTEALLELRDVVNDDEVVEYMDSRLPRWREDGVEGIQAEVRWAYTDVNLLWQEIYRRVPEVFGVEGEQS